MTKKGMRGIRRPSHIDARGRAGMVDVGQKAITDREARARGSIAVSRKALAQIRRGAVVKGNPLQAARLAGIMAAKQTGVEMEALTAVAVAALTIYDMVKAIDKTMVIGDICLEYKSGGRSGTYIRAKQKGKVRPRSTG